MNVPHFEVGHIVKAIPDTEWRGVVLEKHPHRNNGYKVRTTVPANQFDFVGHEFWVRPVSLQHAEQDT